MVMDMGRGTGQGVVELAYQPVVEDYVTALREHRRVSKAGRRQLWVIGAISGVVGLCSAARLADGDVPPYLVVCLVSCALLLVVVPRMQARQLFRVSARNGAHRVTVTETGLMLTTDHTSSTVNWTVQPRYREAGDVFVLFGDDNDAARVAVLPKRGLKDSADADRLREILDRNLTRV